MATERIRTIFLLKRGPEAQWIKHNPVLRKGEPGFVTDKNKLKIGDGVTAWNDLPFIAGDAHLLVDNKTVQVNDDDRIALYGIDSAVPGQMPAKGEDGKLKWVEPTGDERIPDSEIHEIIDN